MGLFGASKGSAEHDADTAMDVPLTETVPQGGPHSPTGGPHDHEHEHEHARVPVPVSTSGSKFHYEPHESGGAKGREYDDVDLDVDAESALYVEAGKLTIGSTKAPNGTQHRWCGAGSPSRRPCISSHCKMRALLFWVASAHPHG